MMTRKGYTLVETLISASMLVVLLGIIVYLFLAGNQAWQINEAIVIIQQNLRKAEVSLIKDLQQTAASVMTSPTANGVPVGTATFRLPESVSGGVLNWTTNDIQYYIQSGSIVRYTGGVTRLVATNISDVQFARSASTPELVGVSLTSSVTTDRGLVVSRTMIFDVQLRN